VIAAVSASRFTVDLRDPSPTAGNDAFSVMCIEDNISLIDALESRLMLESGFAGMIRADVLSEAVAVVVDKSPTVILLDYDLPHGLDALQLLQRIVRAVPGSRVIMFTGYPKAQLIADSISLGAWGFVSKGTETDRLISAIHRVRHGEVVVELDA